MKTTIKQLLDMAQGIAMMRNSGQPIPVKFAWALGINAKRIIPLAQVAEELRQQLIAKYSQKDERGEPVIIDGNFQMADAAAFAREMAPQVAEEVEIDLHMVDIDHLPASIELGVLELLAPMIRE